MKNSGKGLRLPSNLISVREYNGQIRITIPRGMCNAIDLVDGDVVKFTPTGKGLLIEKDRRTIEEFRQNADMRKTLEKEVE